MKKTSLLKNHTVTVAVNTAPPHQKVNLPKSQPKKAMMRNNHRKEPKNKKTFHRDNKNQTAATKRNKTLTLLKQMTTLQIIHRKNRSHPTTLWINWKRPVYHKINCKNS